MTGVTAALPQWPHGLETWKQQSLRIFCCALLPQTAYSFASHTACKSLNLQILKFALQYFNNTLHIQLCNFKYQSVTEQGGN